MSIPSIILPLSIVASTSSFCKIALAKGHAIVEVSLIYVTIGIDHDAIGLVEIIFPISLVLVTVDVEFDTVSISLILRVPLTFVGRAVCHLDGWSACQTDVVYLLETITLTIPWVFAGKGSEIHALSLLR